MGFFDVLFGRRTLAPASAADVLAAVGVDPPPKPRDETTADVLTGVVGAPANAFERGYALVGEHLPSVSEAMEQDGPGVYERMEGDAEIRAGLFQIRRRIVGRRIEWAPPEGFEGDPLAVEIATYVTNVLRAEIDERSLVDHLLRALTRRFRVAQVVWRPDAEGAYGPAGTLIPDHVRHERTTAYGVTDDGVLFVRRAGRAVPLTPPAGPFDRKFIFHRHDPEVGAPEGTSLLDGVYWEWKFLRAGLGFWLDLLDRFGVPSLVALFESVSEQAGDAKAVAAEIAGQLSLVARGAPAALNARSLVTPSTGGRGADFDLFLRFLEKRIRKGLLATTLTVDVSDVGARAQGEVSEREVDGVARWHGAALEGTLSRTLGRWTAEMRYGPAARRLFPRARLDWFEPAGFDAYMRAAGAGLPVSREAAYTVHNLPRPNDDDDAFVATGPVAPPGGAGVAFGDAPFGRAA